MKQLTLLFSRGAACLGLWVSCLFLGVVVHAAEPASASVAQTTLDASRQLIQQVQTRLADATLLDDSGLVSLRNSLTSTQLQVQELASTLEPEFNSVQARLNELGVNDGAQPESEALSEQRAQLQLEYSTLDGQIKQARLMAVEARQGLEQISKLRRSLFQAELGTRSQSVLSVHFWRNVRRDFPDDWARANTLFAELSTHLYQVPRLSWLPTLAGVSTLILLMVWLARRLTLFTVSHTQPTRLRRSFHAAALIVFFTLTPGLVFTLLEIFLQAQSDLSVALSRLLDHLVWAAYLAGFVCGLGRVLLAPHRPSWRLPPIPSVVADTLSPLPYLLAVLLAFSWVSQQFLGLINASLSTALLINSINTLCLNVVIAFAAWTVATALRRLQGGHPDGAKAQVPAWLGLAPAGLLLAMASSVLAFLLGYIALGSVIVQEVLWLALVLCSAYVVLVLLTDLTDSLLQSIRDRAAQHRWADTQLRARSQVVVLLAGAIRVCVVVMSATLVLLPFGEHPGDWLQKRLGFVSNGFSVGQVQIKPAAVLVALLVMLIGLYVVKLLQRWLAERFLPVTRLDPGMRTSTANLFSYLGYFLVFALVLSSLGIGLNRMAWIISALSVGIGFGLQAVVQNFVSGLILLAERPIKVGDWVSVNGVDGNVRKINARATEIEMFDRSTLIVPNSEFITKSVRNVTLTNPLGLVKVQITMPITIDAKMVRDVMLSVINAHPDVLAEPAPGVSLDGFDANSGLLFSATCYVNSPRQAAGTRSALMFDILDQLRQRNLALHHTQSMSLQMNPAQTHSLAAAQEVSKGD